MQNLSKVGPKCVKKSSLCILGIHFEGVNSIGWVGNIIILFTDPRTTAPVYRKGRRAASPYTVFCSNDEVDDCHDDDDNGDDDDDEGDDDDDDDDDNGDGGGGCHNDDVLVWFLFWFGIVVISKDSQHYHDEGGNKHHHDQSILSI